MKWYSYRIIGDGPHRVEGEVYLTQEERYYGSGQFSFTFGESARFLSAPVEGAAPQLAGPPFRFLFEESQDSAER
jgi:hypothetical protein